MEICNLRQMIQEILVLLFFAAAVFLLGRILYRSLFTKKGCASGCGKCGVDFSRLGEQLKERGL
jgi:hypothetical protein